MVKNYEDDEVFEVARATEKESLLKKYDIPVNHLDFKYVETCTNGKEIEHILEILKSGQEGYYPDLQKCVEERLFVLNPRSKSLRKVVPVLSKYDLQKSEWENLSSDIQNWVEEIQENDLELSSFRNIKLQTNNIPIRQLNKTKIKTQSNNKNVERIKSMDYSSWDKLDVDAEILKMQITDEKEIKESLKYEKDKEKLNTVIVKPDLMSRVELEHAAMEAKNLGNDFFNEKDYEEALRYYENSITFYPTLDVYNNRALTNLKLKKYNDAILDCIEVLNIDDRNEKGLLRMVEALKNLNKYEEAYDVVQSVIKLYPNNELAQKFSVQLRPVNEISNTVRMHVQTVGDAYEDEYQDVIIPLQQTSTYYGPSLVCETLRISQVKKIGKSVFSNAGKIKTVDLNKIKDKFRREHSAAYLLFADLNGKRVTDFIRMWVRLDLSSFMQHEMIMRQLKPTDLKDVLGNILTEGIFLTIIYCLNEQFVYKSDMKFIGMILSELTTFSNFERVMRAVKGKNKTFELRHLLGIVQKHEYKFSQNVIQKYIL